MKKTGIILLIISLLVGKLIAQNPILLYNLSHKSDKDGELSFHFVGDLMGHSPLFKYALNGQGEYDFYPYFQPVASALEDADFTVGNLETVLAGKTKDYSGYPAFNTPNSYADALKKVGFDFLITTNNHSYDKGETGVLRTLDELHKRKLTTFGTYRSYIERDTVRLFQSEKITFAILAYTQFSNIKVNPDKNYLVNVYHENLVKRQIAEARKAGAQLVIVHYHWGNEYKKEPYFFQHEMTKTAIDAGADLIVADHPHVLQPLEWKKASATAAVDSVLIAYSLGNFISNQQWRYSDAGAILRVGFAKKDKKFRISTYEYVPTWVFKGVENGKSTFRILPSQLSEKNKLPKYLVEKSPYTAMLNGEHWRKMTEAYTDTRNVLQMYGVKAEVRGWFVPKKFFTPSLDVENLPIRLFEPQNTQLFLLNKIIIQNGENTKEKKRKKRKRERFDAVLPRKLVLCA